MNSYPNVDDSIDRTGHGEQVRKLVGDESRWSADCNGNTEELRISDANLEVVQGDRHLLATENSEAAPNKLIT